MRTRFDADLCASQTCFLPSGSPLGGLVALLLGMVLAGASAGPVGATERRATYSGVPTVIDGDTIRIGTDDLRLMGIDAPESSQTCQRGGRLYACGAESRRQLRELIANSPVQCTFRDWNPARYAGQKDRAVVTCVVRGLDVGDWMISRGWAIPYFRTGYENAGQLACEARLGLWAGVFTRPSSYRRQAQGQPYLLGYGSGRDCRSATRIRSSR